MTHCHDAATINAASHYWYAHDRSPTPTPGAVCGNLPWVPLIDHIGEATRQELIRAGTPVAVDEGGYLVHDGDAADSAFFVVDGMLKIVKTSLDGQIAFLGFRRAGTLVGELAILSGSTRASAMQAVRRSELIRIGRDRFEQLLAQNAELSRALLGELAERLREATQQIQYLTSADATTRMASRLVRLADDTLDRPDENPQLSLPVSQEELGEWAGLSRAGAVKALRALRDGRLIETSRMAISITDLPALRDVAVI